MKFHTGGCHPDRPDHRDLTYSEIRPRGLLRAVLRPKTHYLRADNLPRVYHQGHLGACVGHGVAEAVAYAIDYEMARADGTMPTDYSRLFAYYNARRHKAIDEGATIRDGVKGVVRYGLPEEKFWPYVEAKFAQPPPAEAYEVAKAHVAIEYRRVVGVSEVKDCLLDGYPVVFGATVFDSIQYVERTHPRIRMPTEDEAPAGGHCMLIIGYSERKNALLVRNSWGLGWGWGGNAFMSFAYYEEFAHDAWTIRRVGA